MNDVFENIYLRRSVRDYKPNDVPDDIIRELIKAGTYAPSAVNKQPWRFVVIKNREMVGRLSERAKKLWLDSVDKSSDPDIKRLANIMKIPEFNIFYNAPVLILIFAAPDAYSPQYRLRLGGREHDARRQIPRHRQLLDRVRYALGF